MMTTPLRPWRSSVYGTSFGADLWLGTLERPRAPELIRAAGKMS